MDELKSRQEKPDEDKKPEEGGTHKRKKADDSFSEFLQLYGKYILMAIAAIIVVVVVIVAVGKLKGNTGETTGSSSVPAVTESGETQPPALPGGTLEKGTNQAVNALVNSYFTAVQGCDVEALSALVNSVDSISVEQLQAEREFVEGYQNISCYTLNGSTDGTYVVYVSYDMKFLNVETPAPCLIRLYVCTNEQGGLYIFNQESGMDASVVSYMEELNGREDIKALMSDVDVRLTEAMAADEALNALVSKLYGNNAPSESEEGETSEESSAEETPEETEETKAPEETTASSADNSSFTEVDETVYAKEGVNIRKEPQSDAEVVGTIQAGESIHRTGYNDNWSRVEYGGETCYIAAGFLTMTEPGEDEDDGFTEVDEKVYAKESVRIRKSPEEGAEVVGTLLEGESLKRTGYNDEWSRVVYEGETCYIGAGFLTTADPSEEE
ncbi:MAG: SH3 domain-containing protein [Lachnospiraceae bacterium]|nr:SH3 domain-containing protein [Lachnospiraceae bacterium]